MANKGYTDTSIQKMDPLTFTRHRPDSYLGSNEDSSQLFREIITNSVDEALIGNCSEIHVEYNESSNIATIWDNGQGILPNHIREDGKTDLETVYGDINTSGKYDKSEDAVYKISTGAFGIGAALTCFLSHWLIAVTERDGAREEVSFKEGVFQSRKVEETDPERHGVCVKFLPSEDFFRDAHPNVIKLKEELFYASCVCPGLRLYYNDEEFFHPEGLFGIVSEKTADKNELVETPLTFHDKQDAYTQFDCCLTFVAESTNSIVPFCNYSIIETGAPVTAIKATLTKVLNSWAREKNILKDKDKNLDGASLQEGLVLVFNLVSKNIRYDSQTKVRVTSTEDNQYLSSVLSTQLEVWLDSNPQDGRNIIEKALVARKATEAARKAREAVRKKAEGKGKKLVMPSKLADCHSKKRGECELYVTEGDSASGGAKLIRNASTQAVLGLRGKVLNCLVATPRQIMKNAEVVDIIKALGFDYDFTEQHSVVHYDPKKLRYGKFIIAADRDSDGSHIQLLVLSLLWKLVPQMVKDGYVYVALPPLYKAEWGTKYQYLQDKQELDAFSKSHKEFTLTYFKGLGEASPQELGSMIIDPSTRKLAKVTIADAQAADKIINDLMGADAAPKKAFVFGEEG